MKPEDSATWANFGWALLGLILLMTSLVVPFVVLLLFLTEILAWSGPVAVIIAALVIAFGWTYVMDVISRD